MEVTRGKLLSLLIAAGYLVVLAVLIVAKGLPASSFLGLAGAAFALCVPLGLIWFATDLADGIGARDSYRTGKHLSFPSILITLAGWLILIGIPILVVYR